MVFPCFSLFAVDTFTRLNRLADDRHIPIAMGMGSVSQMNLTKIFELWIKSVTHRLDWF